MIDKTGQLVRINSVEYANGKIYVYLVGLVIPELQYQDPNIVRAFEVKEHKIDKEHGKYLLTLILHDDVDTEILVSTYYEDYQKILSSRSE